ncbi:hypothetical protein A3K73_00115 [Candidatus Pacearchaeota archaeon RBG_13_36_9]|nr:MAG: hypothetical protein A3K73_00115 [Candidatus Pacearchaeota archaeon RBG_13_36_9]
MKGRKAQSIGSGITWMVATPIIFCILALFLLISLASYAADKKGITITKGDMFAEKLILTKKLVGFLNKQAGEAQTVKDLILQAGVGDGEKERIKLFRAEAGAFIEEVFGSGCKKYSRSWIRIYKTADETGWDRYTNYDSLKCIIGGNGGIYCDPDNSNAFVVNFLADSDKLIVLCGDKG